VHRSWYSEPFHENQNFAEHRFGTLPNRVLNLYSTPAHTWLLVLMYVYFLMIPLASADLGWKPPMQVLNGQPKDISQFLQIFL
jgi:hypothetical protein